MYYIKYKIKYLPSRFFQERIQSITNDEDGSSSPHTLWNEVSENIYESNMAISSKRWFTPTNKGITTPVINLNQTDQADITQTRQVEITRTKRSEISISSNRFSNEEIKDLTEIFNIPQTKQSDISLWWERWFLSSNAKDIGVITWFFHYFLVY